MYKYKVELPTLTDVENFTQIAKRISEDVRLIGKAGAELEIFWLTSIQI